MGSCYSDRRSTVTLIFDENWIKADGFQKPQTSMIRFSPLNTDWRMIVLGDTRAEKYTQKQAWFERRGRTAILSALQRAHGRLLPLSSSINCVIDSSAPSECTCCISFNPLFLDEVVFVFLPCGPSVRPGWMDRCGRLSRYHLSHTHTLIRQQLVPLLIFPSADIFCHFRCRPLPPALPLLADWLGGGFIWMLPDAPAAFNYK